MDWSKAKSILIVALIITNILLGLILYQSERNMDSTLKKGFIEDVVRLLEDKGIKFDTEIPRKIPQISWLTVEYENVEPDIINKNFFNDKGTISESAEEIVDIGYNDELITITNEKLLMYQSKSDKIIYDIKDEDDAVNIAMNFLNDKNFSTEDMKLSYIRQVDDGYKIEFTKLYNSNFLENSYTIIHVGNKGVVEMERKWLNVVDVGEKPLSISSAPKSILGLLSMEDAYGRCIKDISICYYFEPEKNAYVDNPDEAKQGRATPAWRIQFDDGHKVFIDSYNYY